MYNNELYHHGVKGQKWGVRHEREKTGNRRYQRAYNKEYKRNIKKGLSAKEADREAKTWLDAKRRLKRDKGRFDYDQSSFYKKGDLKMVDPWTGYQFAAKNLRDSNGKSYRVKDVERYSNEQTKKAVAVYLALMGASAAISIAAVTME